MIAVHKVDEKAVRRQILEILHAWGMDAGLAQTTADAMVETDLLGVDSHGISMLMTYEQRHREGKLNLTVPPRVVRQNACTALVDGMSGLGHPAATFAMSLAVEKAKAAGVAVVGVRNSHHFGAAGVYARIAAAHGLIGMVTSATRSILMVPTGARTPVLGTNPIAFAAPAKRNRPFVLDMATTTAAGNKVRVFGLNDRPLPAGWVVDGAGNGVTDPHAAWKMMSEGPEGGLSPLGGSLVGASFSPIRKRTQKPSDPDDLGHFFLALDPTSFREEGEFEADLDDVIDELHGTPPADPAKPVLVAGDPEAAAREERLRDGIPIPDTLDRAIRGVCERSGAAYVLR